MNFFQISLTLCFAIGALYALAELIGKFRVLNIIFTIPWGYFYLIFNGFISVLAFLVIKDFNTNANEYTKIDGVKVLLAGTSAMVVIRSWIFSVRVDNRSYGSKKTKQVEGSLAPIIQVFLSYVEREFDRKKAEQDVKRLNVIMRDVDFEKAAPALPYTCANLLRTMSSEDGKEIAKKVSELSKTAFDNGTKLLNLGLILLEHMGFDLLEIVVKEFKSLPPGGSKLDELNDLINLFK